MHRITEDKNTNAGLLNKRFSLKVLLSSIITAVAQCFPRAPCFSANTSGFILHLSLSPDHICSLLATTQTVKRLQTCALQHNFKVYKEPSQPFFSNISSTCR